MPIVTLLYHTQIQLSRNKSIPQHISIHATSRVATTEFVRSFGLALISIHAPAGGATFEGGEISNYYNISIHAPAGGATERGRERPWRVQFQSTPLREGRPQIFLSSRAALHFNPRPCGRGDYQIQYASATDTDFNPRPCGRGDRNQADRERVLGISIHAPAGGATGA